MGDYNYNISSERYFLHMSNLDGEKQMAGRKAEENFLQENGKGQIVVWCKSKR